MTPPRHEDIRRRSTAIYDMNRSIFLTETHLYGQLAQLLLAPVEEADSRWKIDAKWPDDVKTALVLAIARMFNDFEASQSLILQGLAEQAYMPVRDSIECMMLTRLFRLDPEKAPDWLYKLKHYPAAHVRQWLEERGENPPEYNFYDFFSRRSHANLIASAYRVEETTTSDGSLESRTVNFGAYPNHLATAIAFKFLLAMMYCAIRVALPPLYVPFMHAPEEWQSNVRALQPELEKLDPRLWQLLSGSESVSDDDLSKWEQDMIRRKSGQQTLERKLKPILDQGAEDA